MAGAYSSDGLDAALALFASYRKESPMFSAAVSAIRPLLPVQRICDELLRYDTLIGEFGTGAGSRAALDRWELTPRYELPGAAWRALSGGGFVAFGNHTAGIEAALFNSLFVRDDIAHVAGAFIGQVGPNLRSLVRPIHNTDARSSRAPLGWRARAMAKLESYVWPARDDFAAKRDNLRSLGATAEFVARGGGAHLFPAGSMNSQDPWQAGLGHLVKLIARAPDSGSVSIVPLVYGVSDAHVMASRLFRGCPTRVLGRLLLGPSPAPPYVYAPEPLTLAQIDTTGSAATITRDLFEYWSRARDKARGDLPRWPAAARSLRPPLVVRGGHR